MKTHIAWTILLMLASCGRMKPSDTPAETSDLNGSDQSRLADVVLTESFTASHQSTPVDILILRENSDRINSTGAPFSYRLFREGNIDFEQGFQEMAVRLYFLKANWQVGFLEPMFNDDTEARNRGGLLVSHASAGSVLTPNTTNFLDTFASLSMIAPGPTISDSVLRGNASFLYPLQSLRSLMRRTNEGGSSHQFLRPGALLTVLYVGYLPENKESIDVQDMVSELDASRGAGNWVVHVLSPPKDGCSFRTIPANQERHSNMDPAAANSDDPAVYNAFKRPNKMIKLQEYSGGMFKSLCDDSYVEFMENVVDEGTRNAHFPVKLKDPADPKSIVITVNHSEVEGWRYIVETQTLLVPTTVTSGSEFVVLYKHAGVTTTVADDGSVAGDSITPIVGQKLSQSEIDYYGGIRDVLQSNGCIGCHAAYGNYLGAWDNRTQILDRINRTPGATGFMPQGRPDFDTQANKDALIGWLTSN
jgi:hypothetical protein